MTCNIAGCQLRGMGLAVGKECWVSGVLFRGLPLWISLVSRGFQCLRWAEMLKLFLSSSVFMGSFSSYELFIIPRLSMVLFIIPDFLTPNIHYSFSFKPRNALFIIQLPPPIRFRRFFSSFKLRTSQLHCQTHCWWYLPYTFLQGEMILEI